MTVKSKKTHGRGIRFTAFIVILAFTVTSVTWTTPAVAAPTDAASPAVFPMDTLAIPPEMGTITRIRMADGKEKPDDGWRMVKDERPAPSSALPPPSGRFVVLIQDAHAVVDAQENIAKILGVLQKNYGVRLTALEGAKGRLEPILLKTFPELSIKRKIFAGYEKRAELTGPEMAAVLQEDAGEFRGMEDWGVYEKNYSAYLDAQQKKDPLLGRWNTFKRSLDRERAEVYNSDLNAFEEVRENFLSERASLLDLLLYLSRFKGMLTVRHSVPEKSRHREEPRKRRGDAAISPAKTEIAAPQFESTGARNDVSGKDSEQYQELPGLIASIGYEQSGKPEALAPLVRKIADEFKMKYLRGLGVKSEMNFYNRYQAFMTGQITAGQMLQYLVQLGSEHGKVVELTPELKKLLGHAETLSGIKGSRLCDEIENFLSAVETSLIKTPAERELAEKYRKLFLLKEMIALELTHEGLAKYRKEPDAYLNLIQEKKVTVTLGDSHQTFVKDLAPALEFYQAALERDQAFMEKIDAMMKDTKQKAVAVVAGGFHTRGLERILKEKGVAYAVVTPKIASLAGVENYAKVMKGDVSFKDYLKTTYFDALMRHAAKTLVEALPIQGRVRTLKVWRDNVIRELAKDGRIIEAGKYLPYIDEILQSMPEAAAAISPKRTKGEVLDVVRKELEKFKNDSFARIWKTFEFQLDIFTDGLKQLVSKNELTAQTVSVLLDRAGQTKPSFLGLVQSLDPSIQKDMGAAEPVALPVVFESVVRSVTIEAGRSEARSEGRENKKVLDSNPPQIKQEIHPWQKKISEKAMRVISSAKREQTFMHRALFLLGSIWWYFAFGLEVMVVAFVPLAVSIYFHELGHWFPNKISQYKSSLQGNPVFKTMELGFSFYLSFPTHEFSISIKQHLASLRGGYVANLILFSISLLSLMGAIRSLSLPLSTVAMADHPAFPFLLALGLSAAWNFIGIFNLLKFAPDGRGIAQYKNVVEILNAARQHYSFIPERVSEIKINLQTVFFKKRFAIKTPDGIYFVIESRKRRPKNSGEFMYLASSAGFLPIKLKGELVKTLQGGSNFKFKDHYYALYKITNFPPELAGITEEDIAQPTPAPKSGLRPPAPKVAEKVSVPQKGGRSEMRQDKTNFRTKVARWAVAVLLWLLIYAAGTSIGELPSEPGIEIFGLSISKKEPLPPAGSTKVTEDGIEISPGNEPYRGVRELFSGKPNEYVKDFALRGGGIPVKQGDKILLKLTGKFGPSIIQVTANYVHDGENHILTLIPGTKEFSLRNSAWYPSPSASVTYPIESIHGKVVLTKMTFTITGGPRPESDQLTLTIIRSEAREQNPTMRTEARKKVLGTSVGSLKKPFFASFLLLAAAIAYSFVFADRFGYAVKFFGGGVSVLAVLYGVLCAKYQNGRFKTWTTIVKIFAALSLSLILFYAPEQGPRSVRRILETAWTLFQGKSQKLQIEKTAAPKQLLDGVTYAETKGKTIYRAWAFNTAVHIVAVDKKKYRPVVLAASSFRQGLSSIRSFIANSRADVAMTGAPWAAGGKHYLGLVISHGEPLAPLNTESDSILLNAVLAIKKKTGDILMTKIRDPRAQNEILSHLDEYEHVLQAGPLLIEDGKLAFTDSEALNLERDFAICALDGDQNMSFIIVRTEALAGIAGPKYADVAKFLLGRGYRYAIGMDGGSSAMLEVRDKLLFEYPIGGGIATVVAAERVDIADEIEKTVQDSAAKLERGLTSKDAEKMAAAFKDIYHDSREVILMEVLSRMKDLPAYPAFLKMMPAVLKILSAEDPNTFGWLVSTFSQTAPTEIASMILEASLEKTFFSTVRGGESARFIGNIADRSPEMALRILENSKEINYIHLDRLDPILYADLMRNFKDATRKLIVYAPVRYAKLLLYHPNDAFDPEGVAKRRSPGFFQDLYEFRMHVYVDCVAKSFPDGGLADERQKQAFFKFFKTLEKETGFQGLSEQIHSEYGAPILREYLEQKKQQATSSLGVAKTSKNNSSGRNRRTTRSEARQSKDRTDPSSGALQGAGRVAMSAKDAKPAGSGWFYGVVLGICVVSISALGFYISPYIIDLFMHRLYLEGAYLLAHTLIFILQMPNVVAGMLSNSLIAFNVSSKTWDLQSKYYTRTPVTTTVPSAQWPTLMAIAPIHTESWDVVRITLESNLAALERYNQSVGSIKATLVVLDDGLMDFTNNNLTEAWNTIRTKPFEELGQNEKEVYERMRFYERHKIVVVARPKHNTSYTTSDGRRWTFKRKGIFPKAGNQVHALTLLKQYQEAFGVVHDTTKALQNVREIEMSGNKRAAQKGENAVPLFQHTEVLNIDQFSGLSDTYFFTDKYCYAPLNGLVRAMPEFLADPDLGFVQMGLYSNNYDENFISRALSQELKTRSKYNAPVDAHYMFPKFIGHNCLFRRDAYEAAGGLSEEYVSEDVELSLRVAMTKNRATGNPYYGKRANYTGPDFTSLLALPDEDLAARCRKYGITDELVRAAMANGPEACINRAHLMGIRKGVLTQYLKAHGDMLDEHMTRAVLIYAEEQTDFSKGAPLGMNAEIIRRMKFMHGDTELAINPIVHWFSRGVLSDTARAYLFSKEIPWFAKTNLVLRALRAGMFGIGYLFSAGIMVLYGLYGIEFFYRANFVQLFIASSIAAALSAVVDIVASLRAFRKEGVSLKEGFLISTLSQAMTLGLRHFLTFSILRFHLGLTKKFDATPIFKKIGDAKEMWGLITRSRRNVMLFTLGNMALGVMAMTLNPLSTWLSVYIAIGFIFATIFAMVSPYLLEPSLWNGQAAEKTIAGPRPVLFISVGLFAALSLIGVSGFLFGMYYVAPGLFPLIVRGMFSETNQFVFMLLPLTASAALIVSEIVSFAHRAFFPAHQHSRRSVRAKWMLSLLLASGFGNAVWESNMIQDQVRHRQPELRELIKGSPPATNYFINSQKSLNAMPASATHSSTDTIDISNNSIVHFFKGDYTFEADAHAGFSAVLWRPDETEASGIAIRIPASLRDFSRYRAITFSINGYPIEIALNPVTGEEWRAWGEVVEITLETPRPGGQYMIGDVLMTVKGPGHAWILGKINVSKTLVMPHAASYRITPVVLHQRPQMSEQELVTSVRWRINEAMERIDRRNVTTDLIKSGGSIRALGEGTVILPVTRERYFGEEKAYRYIPSRTPNKESGIAFEVPSRYSDMTTVKKIQFTINGKVVEVDVQEILLAGDQRLLRDVRELSLESMGRNGSQITANDLVLIMKGPHFSWVSNRINLMGSAYALPYATEYSINSIVFVPAKESRTTGHSAWAEVTRPSNAAVTAADCTALIARLAGVLSDQGSSAEDKIVALRGLTHMVHSYSPHRSSAKTALLNAIMSGIDIAALERRSNVSMRRTDMAMLDPSVIQFYDYTDAVEQVSFWLQYINGLHQWKAALGSEKGSDSQALGNAMNLVDELLKRFFNRYPYAKNAAVTMMLDILDTATLHATPPNAAMARMVFAVLDVKPEYKVQLRPILDASVRKYISPEVRAMVGMAQRHTLEREQWKSGGFSERQKPQSEKIRDLIRRDYKLGKDDPRFYLGYMDGLNDKRDDPRGYREYFLLQDIKTVMDELNNSSGARKNDVSLSLEYFLSVLYGEGLGVAMDLPAAFYDNAYWQPFGHGLHDFVMPPRHPGERTAKVDELRSLGLLDASFKEGNEYWYQGSDVHKGGGGKEVPFTVCAFKDVRSYIKAFGAIVLQTQLQSRVLAKEMGIDWRGWNEFERNYWGYMSFHAAYSVRKSEMAARKELGYERYFKERAKRIEVDNTMRVVSTWEFIRQLSLSKLRSEMRSLPSSFFEGRGEQVTKIIDATREERFWAAQKSKVLSEQWEGPSAVRSELRGVNWKAVLLAGVIGLLATLFSLSPQAAGPREEVTRQPLLPTSAPTASVEELRKFYISRLTPYFNEGVGLVRTQFNRDGKNLSALVPVDHIRNGVPALYSQPLAVGIWGNVLAQQVEGDIPKTVKDPLLELENFTDFELSMMDRFGMPVWFQFVPGGGNDYGVLLDPRESVGTEDILGNFGQIPVRIGALLGAKQKTTDPGVRSRIDRLIEKHMALLKRYEPILRSQYDPSAKLLWGDRNVRTGQPVRKRHVQHRANEDRAALAFAVALGYVPEEAWFRASFETMLYRDRKGNRYRVIMPWDGGAFQQGYNNMYAVELLYPHMVTLNANTSEAFRDLYYTSGGTSYYPGAAFVGNDYIHKAGHPVLKGTADTLESALIIPGNALMFGDGRTLQHLHREFGNADIGNPRLGGLIFESFLRGRGGELITTPVHSTVITGPGVIVIQSHGMDPTNDARAFIEAVSVHGVKNMLGKFNNLYALPSLRLPNEPIQAAPNIPFEKVSVNQPSPEIAKPRAPRTPEEKVKYFNESQRIAKAASIKHNDGYRDVAERGDVEAMKTYILRLIQEDDDIKARVTDLGGLSGIAPHYTANVPGVENPEPGKGVQTLYLLKENLKKATWLAPLPKARSEQREVKGKIVKAADMGQADAGQNKETNAVRSEMRMKGDLMRRIYQNLGVRTYREIFSQFSFFRKFVFDPKQDMLEQIREFKWHSFYWTLAHAIPFCGAAGISGMFFWLGVAEENASALERLIAFGIGGIAAVFAVINFYAVMFQLFNRHRVSRILDHLKNKPSPSSQTPSADSAPGQRSEARGKISAEELAKEEARISEVVGKMEAENFGFGFELGQPGKNSVLPSYEARKRITGALGWALYKTGFQPPDEATFRAIIAALNETLWMAGMKATGQVDLIEVSAEAEKLYGQLKAIPAQDRNGILAEIKKFQGGQVLPKGEPQPLTEGFKTEVQGILGDWDSLPPRAKLELEGARYVDLGHPAIQARLRLKEIAMITQEPERVFTRYTDGQFLDESSERYERTVEKGLGFESRNMATLEKGEVKIKFVKKKKEGPGYEVQDFLLDTADYGLLKTILMDHKYPAEFADNVVNKAKPLYEQARLSHDDDAPANFRISAYIPNGPKDMIVEITPVDLGEVGRKGKPRSEARGIRWIGDSGQRLENTLTAGMFKGGDPGLMVGDLRNKRAENRFDSLYSGFGSHYPGFNRVQFYKLVLNALKPVADIAKSFAKNPKLALNIFQDHDELPFTGMFGAFLRSPHRFYQFPSGTLLSLTAVDTVTNLIGHVKLFFYNISMLIQQVKVRLQPAVYGQRQTPSVSGPLSPVSIHEGARSATGPTDQMARREARVADVSWEEVTSEKAMAGLARKYASKFAKDEKVKAADTMEKAMMNQVIFSNFGAFFKKMQEKGIPLSFSPDLKGANILIIGPSRDPHQIKGFLEAYPGIGSIHYVDIRKVILEALQTALTQYTSENGIRTPLRGYWGSILDEALVERVRLQIQASIQKELAPWQGSIDLVFDSYVFAERWWDPGQLEQAGRVIEGLLKDNGIHASFYAYEFPQAGYPPGSQMEKIETPNITREVKERNGDYFFYHRKPGPSRIAKEAKVRSEARGTGKYDVFLRLWEAGNVGEKIMALNTLITFADIEDEEARHALTRLDRSKQNASMAFEERSIESVEKAALLGNNQAVNLLIRTANSSQDGIEINKALSALRSCAILDNENAVEGLIAILKDTRKPMDLRWKVMKALTSAAKLDLKVGKAFDEIRHHLIERTLEKLRVSGKLDVTSRETNLLNWLLRAGKLPVAIYVREVASINPAKNLIHAMGWNKDDVVIVSVGEISNKLVQKSFEGYRVFDRGKTLDAALRIGFLDTPAIMWSSYYINIDVRRFKFGGDHVPDEQVKNAELQIAAGKRPIIVLGSPHLEEMQNVVKIYQKVYGHLPVSQRPLLIIAPRNPQEVADLTKEIPLLKKHIRVRTQSDADTHQPFPSMEGANVLLLNSRGELMELYGLARVAFVGRGHNIDEPARLGKPVLFEEGDWGLTNEEAKNRLKRSGGALVLNEQNFRLLMDDQEIHAKIGRQGLSTSQEMLKESFAEAAEQTAAELLPFLLISIAEHRSEVRNQARISIGGLVKIDPVKMVKNLTVEDIEGLAKEWAENGRAELRRIETEYDKGAGLFLDGLRKQADAAEVAKTATTAEGIEKVRAELQEQGRSEFRKTQEMYGQSAQVFLEGLKQGDAASLVAASEGAGLLAKSFREVPLIDVPRLYGAILSAVLMPPAFADEVKFADAGLKLDPEMIATMSRKIAELTAGMKGQRVVVLMNRPSNDGDAELWLKMIGGLRVEQAIVLYTRGQLISRRWSELVGGRLVTALVKNDRDLIKKARDIAEANRRELRVSLTDFRIPEEGMLRLARDEDNWENPEMRKLVPRFYQLMILIYASASESERRAMLENPELLLNELNKRVNTNLKLDGRRDGMISFDLKWLANEFVNKASIESAA